MAMKILVLNCGSSTLKYQLIDMKTKEAVTKGVFEEIGQSHSFYRYESNGKETEDIPFHVPSHLIAVAKMFELLGDQANTIKAIGHRVVHGGEKYRDSVIATEEIIKGVESVSGFAPLHNPANLLGVRACIETLPSVPNVLVFDTSFHSTIQPHAYLYAVPLCDYREHGIRRYGFHGTSYSYVAGKAAELIGKPLNQLKIVAMHLGGGASVCAIDRGKSADTSMGLTPLEGLVMGSRSGDIDVGAVHYLTKVKNLTIDEALAYLNNNCGLRGLSGVGSDIRKIVAEAKNGSKDAQTTLDVYTHRLIKYIGGYITVMGGVDAIVWTGGIGTNNTYVRKAVMEKLEFMGIHIDQNENLKYNGQEGGRNMTGEISKKGSKVRTFVICTNEELEIALHAQRLVKA